MNTMYDSAICWIPSYATSCAFTCRTSPELARVKTPACSGICVAMPRPSSLVAPALTRHQFDSPKALPGVDVDEQAREHALAVLAPGVGDGGARQLPDALRLVDVPVQAHHRLVLDDRVAGGRAAHRDHLQSAHAAPRAQVLVELGRDVQPAVQWWDVEAQDRAVHALHARGGLVDPLGEVALRDVPRARPGGGIAVAHPHQLEPALQLDHGPVGVLDQLRAGDDVVDLEEVVVGTRDEAAHAGPAELLVGLGDPLLRALDHQPLEERVDARLVALAALQLVRRGDEVVLAGVGDPDPQRLQLLRGRDLALDAHERGGVASAARLDDRDHELPGDVPADHDVGRLVELPRVQELLPALARCVDVGAEVDPHVVTRPGTRRRGSGRRYSSIEVSVIDACSASQPGKSSPKIRRTSAGPTWSHQWTSRARWVAVYGSIACSTASSSVQEFSKWPFSTATLRKPWRIQSATSPDTTASRVRPGRPTDPGKCRPPPVRGREYANIGGATIARPPPATSLASS